MKSLLLSLIIFNFLIFKQSYSCHKTGDSNCTPKQKVYSGSSIGETQFQEVNHHIEIKDDSFNDDPRQIYIIDDFGKEIRGSTLNDIKENKLNTKNKEILIINIDNIINDLSYRNKIKSNFFNKIKSLSKKTSFMIQKIKL